MIRLIGKKKKKRARKRYKRGYDPSKERLRRLKKEYNLTITGYIRMLSSQKGVCKICGEQEKAKDKNGNVKWLAVDHDHKTGKIRGLLCQSCNQKLFLFENYNKDWVGKAKKYLKGE